MSRAGKSVRVREECVIANSRLVFSLYRKAEELGPVPVDHWWMQTTELYGQRLHRRTQGGNHEAVTEAFWTLCQQGGTTQEADVQESYLLSKVLPYARSQGSRRIFADAYLEPRHRAGSNLRDISIQQLDQMIQDGSRKGLTPLQFSRKTGEVLGPPDLPPETIQVYLGVCEELFAPARAGLAAGTPGAVDEALTRWQKQMRLVGRRSGHEVQKQVLDVLSYEARASLHRCYSAVWDMVLLPHLEQKYTLSPQSLAFLRLWHLDQSSESNLGDKAYFHLFHGHVFGLHPACGEFLRTTAGRALMGRWLQQQSEAAFRRLLNGLFLAILQYSLYRDDVTDRRKSQVQTRGVSDLVDLEERQSEWRSGRHKRLSDKGIAPV